MNTALIPTKRLKSVLLPEYIDGYCFYFVSAGEGSQRQDFHMSPEGIFEIILQISKTSWQKKIQQSEWSKREQAFVGGPYDQSYCVRLAAQAQLISIQFKLGMVRHFIQESLHTFYAQMISLVDLWGIKVETLLSRLSECQGVLQKRNMIEKFLLDQLRYQKPTLMDQVVNHINQSLGQATLSQLEKITCLSAVQFRRKFKKHMGVSAKKYLKMVRFKAILRDLSRNVDHANGRTLAEIAQAYGYFDQSHFNKDFKFIMGVSPGQYVGKH